MYFCQAQEQRDPWFGEAVPVPVRSSAENHCALLTNSTALKGPGAEQPPSVSPRERERGEELCECHNKQLRSASHAVTPLYSPVLPNLGIGIPYNHPLHASWQQLSCGLSESFTRSWRNP